MKTIYTYLTAAFILVTVSFASAQSNSVKYLDKNGRKVANKEEAYFFVVEEKTNPLGGTRTRYKMDDSTKVSLFTYSSFAGEDKDDTLDGPYYLWHKNGKLSEKGNHASNKLHGKESTWFENGQLSYEKFYIKGKLQDTLKGYYEDGAVRRVEVYKEGEMVEGKVFSKEGANLPYFPAMVMPEFSGGEQAMMAYVTRNLKYPKSAIKKDVSGLVEVSFVIDANGAIRDLEVTRSVYNALDKEAVRVINSMPNWSPGLLEGKPIPVKFTLPVRFAFQDEL